VQRDPNAANGARRASTEERRADPATTAGGEGAERWALLYQQLRPNLVRALAAACGTYEGVEDAIQEAFATALRRAPADLRSPEAWLFVVALNTIRGNHRRTRVLARLRLTPPQQPNDLDDALVRADVVAILARLSARERELLVAKYYVGMTQEELAKAMGIARGTVASAVSRAAAHFRELDKSSG
jgi:RNA polymerase sigma factor (sigma-70 family)